MFLFSWFARLSEREELERKAGKPMREIRKERLPVEHPKKGCKEIYYGDYSGLLGFFGIGKDGEFQNCKFDYDLDHIRKGCEVRVYEEYKKCMKNK